MKNLIFTVLLLSVGCVDESTKYQLHRPETEITMNQPTSMTTISQDSVAVDTTENNIILTSSSTITVDGKELSIEAPNLTTEYTPGNIKRVVIEFDSAGNITFIKTNQTILFNSAYSKCPECPKTKGGKTN